MNNVSKGFLVMGGGLPKEPKRPAISPSKSGVVLRQPGHAERPSWDDVDEYLREGKHRRRVESYAASDPDFAEQLRWMRNDLKAEVDEQAHADSPTSRRADIVPMRASSSIPPP